MKRLRIVSLFFMSCCLHINAQIGKKFETATKEGNKLTYEIKSDNTVMLLRNEKAYAKMTKIIIPESVVFKGKSYQVSEIEPGCFRFMEQLEVVSIPSTIKELRSVEITEWKKAKNMSGDLDHTDYRCYGTFYGCKNLRVIILPNSISTIEQLAFAGCESLNEISLPSGLLTVGGGCFAGCSSLRNIILPQKMTKIEDALYYHSEYASSTLGWYDKRYYNGFFEDCVALTEVEIPINVTKIDGKTFYGCKSLKKIKGFNTGIQIHKSYDKWGYQDGKIYNLFDGSSISYDSLKSTFSYYAEGEIRKSINNWLLRKEYETVEQYQTRVTKENQQRKIQELMQEAVKGYTKDHPLKVELGNYDADYGLYTLNSNYGKKFVKIPVSDAPAFKDGFWDASFYATYFPTEEGLQINDLTINLNGKTYHAEQTATDITATVIDIDLPEVEIPLGNKPQQNVVQIPVTIDKSIDQDIPLGITGNSKTFAVIIGNEKYSQVAQVPYANNDAKIFAEYCKKTLGLPEKNIKLYENATYGTMIGAVSDMQKIAKAFKGDISVIFYYAGHGIPDEATGDGYLLPIDANGLNMRVCYPLSQLYKDLGNMQARNVTCFMDACFSGAQRGNGMVVAARGVAIKAKSDCPTGNTIVFTAATDKQTAYPYDEKGHGMFTYYLLLKLRETKGDCTLGELGSYICDEVAQQTAVTKGKEQTPIVLTSIGASESWKNMKLKYQLK